MIAARTWCGERHGIGDPGEGVGVVMVALSVHTEASSVVVPRDLASCTRINRHGNWKWTSIFWFALFMSCGPVFFLLRSNAATTHFSKSNTIDKCRNDRSSAS